MFVKTGMDCCPSGSPPQVFLYPPEELGCSPVVEPLSSMPEPHWFPSLAPEEETQNQAASPCRKQNSTRQGCWGAGSKVTLKLLQHKNKLKCSGILRGQLWAWGSCSGWTSAADVEHSFLVTWWA